MLIWYYLFLICLWHDFLKDLEIGASFSRWENQSIEKWFPFWTQITAVLAEWSEICSFSAAWKWYSSLVDVCDWKQALAQTPRSSSSSLWHQSGQSCLLAFIKLLSKTMNPKNTFWRAFSESGCPRGSQRALIPKTAVNCCTVGEKEWGTSWKNNVKSLEQKDA